MAPDELMYPSFKQLSDCELADLLTTMLQTGDPRNPSNQCFVRELAQEQHVRAVTPHSSGHPVQAGPEDIPQGAI